MWVEVYGVDEGTSGTSVKRGSLGSHEWKLKRGKNKKWRVKKKVYWILTTYTAECFLWRQLPVECVLMSFGSIDFCSLKRYRGNRKRHLVPHPFAFLFIVLKETKAPHWKQSRVVHPRVSLHLCPCLPQFACLVTRFLVVTNFHHYFLTWQWKIGALIYWGMCKHENRAPKAEKIQTSMKTNI